MNTGVFLVGAIVFAAGAIPYWKAHKKIEAIKRYEFENRTSGGTVQFKTYDDSRAHERRHRLAFLQAKLAAWPLIFGAITIIASFFL